jgi:hypothetical protein
MPELLSYWLPLDDALPLTRHVNDTIAAMVARAPDKFIGLGGVPMQDPDMAARELERLMRDGFRGVELGSNINGAPLGDPKFDVFFAAAEELGAAVFVHALHPAGEGARTLLLGARPEGRHKLSILNAGGTNRHATEAAQASIDEGHRLVDGQPILQGRFHQDDATARRIHLFAQDAVSRTGGQAETAMDARLDGANHRCALRPKLIDRDRVPHLRLHKSPGRIERVSDAARECVPDADTQPRPARRSEQDQSRKTLR